jgi:signal transduction histidine kinase
MSEEKMNELFTDLPIHSQYGTKGEKGTGIGLLITREFVMINKGTIKVESKLNEGTTFTVSFPIEQN